MNEMIRVFDNVNPFYSKEEDARTFIECLYGDNVYGNYKGSVVICKKLYATEFKNKKILKQISWNNLNNYNYLELELLKHLGEEDVYININPVKSFKSRSKENLHQLKFLYVDLDIEDAREKGKLDLTINQVKMAIETICKDGALPFPTLITNSGRGLHYYWKIGNYASTTKNKKFWEDIQLQIYEVLKEFGADRSIVTDSVRVLRVPGTINSKNKAMCFIEEYNANYTYTLQNIRDKYFKEQLDLELREKKHKADLKKQNREKKGVIAKEENVIDLAKSKTVFTLHKARLEDLIKLIKLRGGDLEGNRNLILLQISYYYAVTHKLATQDNVLEFTLDINKLFSERLDTSEVEHIVKHSLKYAKKKNDYDKIKSLKIKEEMGKVSDLKKGVLYQYSVPSTPLHLGLNYNTSTLLDLFSISSAEMADLKTLISTEEKRDRDFRSRKEKRRTEVSEELGGTKLTPKQKEQMEKRKKAIALLEQGLSKRKVATEMGISLSTLQNLLK